MKELIHYPLLKHNTFGMDVYADRFIEYQSVSDLESCLSRCVDSGRPLLHIGQGSNLLFTGDFHGTVLHSAIRGCHLLNETADSVDIRVGAGVVWDEFVAYTVAHGWYGAENLSWIPGEVGASAVQNIGAYGVEVQDIISGVDALDIETGTPRSFARRECNYAYRSSIFKHEWKGRYVITHVTYRLSKHPQWKLEYGNVRSELEQSQQPVTLQSVRDTIIRIRRAKLPDPQIHGNAGSFFMNPVIPQEQYASLKTRYPDLPGYPAGEGGVKVPAGWLIDRCGWKGKSLGRAGVHPHQALVLVNLGGATAREVADLAAAIAEDVKKQFGISISPEVNYI